VHDAGDGGAQDGDHVGGGELGLVAGRLRRPQERGAPDRTTDPAHLAGEHEAHLLEDRAHAAPVEAVVVADHHLEAVPE